MANENASPCRRVVLIHRQGPYAGLYQILGTTDELPDGKVPAVTAPFTVAIGTNTGKRLALRTSLARLKSTNPLFVLYEEVQSECAKSSPVPPVFAS